MQDLKKTADYTLNALKNAGADKAQVTVSEGRTEEFNVDAGEFSLIRSVFSSGMSVKAIKDKKKGVTSINQLDKKSIDAAVEACMTSVLAGIEDDAVTIAELTENRDFKEGALSPDKERFFDSLIKFTEDVKKEFPQIMIEQLIASYGCGKTVFANTNGVLYTEISGNYSVSVMYSAHDGEKATSFNYFDVDFLDPAADIMSLGAARTMFSRAVKELDTAPFEGKFCGTAVIAPGCMPDFISVILGSFCGDFALIEGTSPWKNMLGKKVADERFTLSVIPLDERVVCGERVTADGYISENYDVIKNGVLNSFCLSEYAARITGLERAKNSSGCVGVTPGEKGVNEIIADIDEGILVCRLSGGEPATNGDFSGVAKNSFLIKNGKIACPLAETMLSGNLTAMLNDIKDISSQTVSDGTCVLPYVAFNGVTVSGK